MLLLKSPRYPRRYSQRVIFKPHCIFVGEVNDAHFEVAILDAFRHTRVSGPNLSRTDVTRSYCAFEGASLNATAAPLHFQPPHYQPGWPTTIVAITGVTEGMVEEVAEVVEAARERDIEVSSSE
jgi:hypothetical protein